MMRKQCTNNPQLAKAVEAVMAEAKELGYTRFPRSIAWFYAASALCAATHIVANSNNALTDVVNATRDEVNRLYGGWPYAEWNLLICAAKLALQSVAA